MINVLFVCLGNICRSPMAEGVFAHLVSEKGLEDQVGYDSAGMIGFHAGELADRRMRNTASSHGIELTHRSRPFESQDFQKFDYIIAMDSNNKKDIEAEKKGGLGKDQHIYMMRDFDDKRSGKAVEDPYYQGDTAFEDCYQILLESNSNFLDYLISKHNLNPKS
ncbi:low molecular weight protein-tyrosine-phosphatase [Flammeovirgaceae bacterium SG7u.111]|nr:low molecular weight protein-tyrosine-phosphatase [Flammeovirgaceae bacterium SG7u.132]WPO33152.1 low molecular weight protein-tyrosine-phosphatase [Flammeovirgaceae bacterium SG7u.111]